MSRVGKKPIEIPEKVKVEVTGSSVKVTGPKGELQKDFPSEIKIEVKGDQVVLNPIQETKNSQAFWGMSRALLANMVKGVAEGFEKKLEIEGVGYRAALEGEDLVLNMGYSHPVKIKKPEGIDFSTEKNKITVSGIDKEKVGQIAAKIRDVRKPEPYKGKGIRYEGEQVRRKAGKKAAGAEGEA